MLYLRPCRNRSKPLWTILHHADAVLGFASGGGMSTTWLPHFWRAGQRSLLAKLNFCLSALAMILVLLPDAPWLTLLAGTIRGPENWRDVSVFLESPIVAKRVAELSSPSDFVLVAASEPQILCYARRQSPTRFITVYALVIPNSRLAAYQAEINPRSAGTSARIHRFGQAELAAGNTPAIALSSFSRLDLLAQDYERVGGYVLEGKNSRWIEPLTDEDAAAASVILYKRKHSPTGNLVGLTR